ncbi:MAG: class I SAM-dependent methyltransferase [Dehalococcoidia bacterium]
MKVAYEKQTIDATNPIARFAHRSRYMSSLAIVTAELATFGTLLDFGSGKGHFLNLLHERRPEANLLGFEPYQDHEAAHYDSIKAKELVEDDSVDIVTCFETLEHLYDDEIAEFVTFVKRVLAPGGKLVVSVPIIGGPTILLKEGNRYVLHRRMDYSVRELLRTSLTGRPAARAENRRNSHKGFDYRALEKMLLGDFKLRQRAFSPFQGAPWFANSQVFWTFEGKQQPAGVSLVA